jgi:hypothetical protein
MNKTSTIILLLLIVMSCSKQADILVGTWKFEGDYHRATYEITEKGNGFVGKVIHYDDGTSRYTSKDELICFEGLVKQDSIYVDGVSGASSSTKETKKGRTICIKVKSQDSLEATTYVSGQPLKEWWIRQK